MLPLRDRVDLGAIAMKGWSAFPKAPALLELHHQIVYCHILDTIWGQVSDFSAEKQSVYSTTLADWVANLLVTVPSTPITIGITVTCSIVFSVLEKGLSTYLSFRFPSVLILSLLLLLEFFTLVLADGLSLEFEWQQVSSSLQDSSQFYGRSQ